MTQRYLGFPLRQIGQLLERPDFDLRASLRNQQGMLRDRATELQRIEGAPGALLNDRLKLGRWDWRLAVHGLEEDSEDQISDFDLASLATLTSSHGRIP